MTSLYNINPDGAYDGTQRSLEDFQFDLGNMLKMSQLVGKSAEERNATSVMLVILAGTKNRTAAEVAAEVVTDAAKVSGQKVMYAVLATNTAGRARMIVREDNTKNGAWAWARLRQRFGRDSGATSCTDVSKYELTSDCLDPRNRQPTETTMATAEHGVCLLCPPSKKQKAHTGPQSVL